MKPTFAFAIALLSTALAAPNDTPMSKFPVVTIQLFNDQTGENAKATILANGEARSIPYLYQNTPVDRNGVILASSAQIEPSIEDATCVLTDGTAIIQLNSTATFASLGNGVVPLNDVSCLCEV